MPSTLNRQLASNLASSFLRLHPDDNIVIARRQAAAETEWSAGNGSPAVASCEPINLGHKMAITRIVQGQPVRKFGQMIGFATEDIEPGEWIHGHNLGVGELGTRYEFATEIPTVRQPAELLTFRGYRRPRGKVATRNYIGIISTVNCSATASKWIAQAFRDELLDDFPNVDGVVALVHGGGCAFGFDGPEHRQLARVLGGFARHPNIGAYLVVGLGCEASQPSYLVDQYDLVQLDIAGRKEPLPLVMNIQDEGGVRKTVSRGIAVLKEMLPEVNRVQREAIPLSELILGTECGGSDGNSGVTANPALGIASDRLVAQGGTSILSEVPEIYGGEHLLTRRAVNETVGRKLIERIEWWIGHTAKFDSVINNNPSVGNKQGGLTTIYEKSLGAIAKGGNSPLAAVYEYAEPVTEKGFVIMDTPGFDPASVTGMVAGGAQIICFTTGRGSCFGCKPAPTIKIATNTPMFERMQDDMDINAGRILDGASVEEVGEEIFEKIIAVASGEKTKSEAQGIGDEEFCPWVPGPVL
ncbi:MAG: UxaA family hydrolase [Planctomycetaceae bacterium]